MPRGRMVTLCRASPCGNTVARIAWPPSWYAVTRFSSADKINESRRAPIMMRSRADSKSMRSICELARRTANKAASFTKLARSAPLMPGVPLAMVSRSTSGPIRLSRLCTRKMAARSSNSGNGTTICRSKRPGRSKAGSSTSGRFVAAKMTMPSDVSNPSISDSIWFNVCSRSS